eukprot:1250526-Amphidinium_carterae.1
MRSQRSCPENGFEKFESELFKAIVSETNSLRKPTVPYRGSVIKMEKRTSQALGRSSDVGYRTTTRTKTM